MKFQDHFNNDKVLLGLYDIFHPVGQDRFFLNVEGVRAIDKTIKKNGTFILLSLSPSRSIMESTVKLLDVFYFKSHVYMLLLDMESEKVMLINQYLDTDDIFCNWRLLDIDYLKQRLEEMKKSNTNIDKQSSSPEDLLEFNY